MKVKEIMTANVECVWSDDTLQEAAQTMREHNIGLLPVRVSTHLAGMITDRDIAIRAVAAGLDPKTTRVSEVMTADFICCNEDDETEQAARLMQERHVRRILVLNRDKMLVGIVSLGDLAAGADDADQIGQVLHTIREPAMSNI
jgi:CBS domain-containing protein